MSDELETSEQGPMVVCLACGDRLEGDRLDTACVHGDDRGHWLVCYLCRSPILLVGYLRMLRRAARLVRSLGVNLELRVDRQEW